MEKTEISNRITEIINECNHHPFLFVGSGFTKRYFGTENWEDLLKKFSCEFYKDDLHFYKHKNSINSSEPNIVYPKIASLLEKDYNTAIISSYRYVEYREEYEEQIKSNISEFRKKYKEKIKKGISPFKIKLSEYFNINVSSCVKEKEEFKFFKNNVAPYVAGIITTNYDLVLDSIFNKFKVYTSQEELLFADIYNIGEIYKIHGSIKDPSSIVITEEDYNNFNKKYAYLAAKLLAIFLEHPIIFLGYSMSDSNISSIMKSISECLTNKQLEKLGNRLIFVEYSTEKEKIETFSKEFDGKIIYMTKIVTNNFLEIYKGITDTTITIKPRILRQFRKYIYELAQITNPDNKISAVDFEKLDSIPEDVNLLLSIAVNKNGYGEKPVEAETLYRDIIFNNLSLTPYSIVKYHLPKLLKGNKGGLPIYKYLKEYHEKEYQDDIDDSIKKELEKRKSLDDFLNNTLINRKYKYRKKLKEKTIDEIIDIEKTDKRALYKICFLNEDEINLNTLHSYLKNIYHNKDNDENDKSAIKRLIRIYDFLKNKS